MSDGLYLGITGTLVLIGIGEVIVRRQRARRRLEEQNLSCRVIEIHVKSPK
jgi:transketolase C-terminal domain/subunit